MVRVEYHMLNGECIKGNFLYASYKKDDFLLVRKRPEDESEGMFKVLEHNREKLTLEQIDCNPLHWRINSRRGKGGPNGDCKLKCKYFAECPIKDHILLLKSGFE